MRYILGVLIGWVLTLTACQTGNQQKTETRDYMLRELEWTGNFLGGKNAFVSFTAHDVAAPELQTETKTSIQQLQDSLKQLGYTLVEARADADLWIDVEYRPILQSAKSQTLSVLEGNKLIKSQVLADIESKTYVLDIRGSAQNYGQRPKLLFSGFIKTGTQKRLAQVLRDKSPGWAKELSQIIVQERKSPSKGKPGCLPRFGFEVTVAQSEQGFTYSISKVNNGSAAEKAGMKVGDELIAIDSMDYNAFSTSGNSDRVYEKMLVVPVKLMRDKKEVRTKIKPQMSCE